MYYLGSRYYSPELCRFISADTESVLFKDFENLIQYNLYAYCWNNPVNMMDVMGYWPEWINKAATLVAVGVTVAGAVAATVVAFGAASVAGVIAITSALTMTARAVEVGVLRARKSADEGKEYKEIVTDIVEAIYENDQEIIGSLPKTKALGLGYNYTKNQIKAIANNTARLGFVGTIGSIGGKALPYLFVTRAWSITIYSALYDSPLLRAEQRGYTLN